MEQLQKRLSNLLTVKSIVTITLTAVFAYLAVTGHISQEFYKTIYAVIIAFYFGTQNAKADSKGGDVNGSN